MSRTIPLPNGKTAVFSGDEDPSPQDIADAVAHSQNMTGLERGGGVGNLQMQGGQLSQIQPPQSQVRDPMAMIDAIYKEKMGGEVDSSQPQMIRKADGTLDFADPREEMKYKMDLASKYKEGDTFKEEVVQDRLEKTHVDRLMKQISNRSGGLGLQDGKVNQAIHLRALIDQAYDPKTKQYNIPPVQYEELSIGLANLVSNSNTVTESMINGIRQKTAKGDLSGALTYALGMPRNASTQAIFKNLVSSIDRQGTVSEDLRNKYVESINKMAPKGLDKERVKELTDAMVSDNSSNPALGSSYREYLKNNSPDQQAQETPKPKEGWNHKNVFEGL